MRLQHQCVTTTRLSTRISVLAVRGAFLACVFAPLAHAAEKEAQDPAAGTASSLTGPPTPAQLSTLQGIRNAGLPAFQNTDLKAKRTSYDGGFDPNFTPQWDLSASYRHETKNGTKPVAVVSSISTFESTLILSDLVDTSTDQYKLALNYTGDKGNAQAAYHGTLGSNVNSYDNLPQSKRLNQFSLDADYAVATGHTLAAGYEFQKIDATATAPGSVRRRQQHQGKRAARGMARAPEQGHQQQCPLYLCPAHGGLQFQCRVRGFPRPDGYAGTDSPAREPDARQARCGRQSHLFPRANGHWRARRQLLANPATTVPLPRPSAAPARQPRTRLSGQYALDVILVRMLYPSSAHRTDLHDGTQLGVDHMAPTSEQSPGAGARSGFLYHAF
jgi:hypothetical protein